MNPTVTLLQGQESQTKIELLLSLTSITSDDVKRALVAHFAHGYATSMAQNNFDVSQQAFSRAAVKLNNVYKTVRKINDETL